MTEPVHTVTANSFIKRAGGAAPIGVVAAFLAQHNNHRGGDPHAGRTVEVPVSTLTTSGSHQSVVAAHMLSLKGSDRRMSGADEPAPTVTAGGLHIAEVRAFLMKYYGASVGQKATDPLHTVRTHDNIALVMVRGEPYEIVDIGMRMLSPRELFRAQGFPDTYIIDPIFNGKPLTKTAQIRMCGNSVCPPVVEALTRANVGASSEEAEAA
jgi:DNA (cytosine-5)-methyltransferase 1